VGPNVHPEIGNVFESLLQLNVQSDSLLLKTSRNIPYRINKAIIATDCLLRTNYRNQLITMVVTAVITEDTRYLHLKAEKPVLRLPHAETTTGTIVPIKHAEGSHVDFGAEVYGIDLNNFTDADFEFISDALHKWKLLVFKDQPEMLKPQQQYLLTSK
jgi:hypothetical protein